MTATETIKGFLAKRYKHLGERGIPLCAEILALWVEHEPYADSHFVEEFCNGNEETFHQRYWEMVLTQKMLQQNFRLSKLPEGSPDILAQSAKSKFWIEATCPTPGIGANRLPEEYLNPPQAQAINVPHEAILLRWMSAIATKFQAYQEYRQTNVIAATDPYVIAINPCLLGGHGFIGISQFPHAIEAVFPVGPWQLRVNRETLEVVARGYEFRPNVVNANNARVAATTFLENEYNGVSAILAATRSPHLPVFEGREWIAIHNPLAANPIPVGVLGAGIEYVAREKGDEYEVEVIRHL